jgi:hypothetical protein
MSLAGNCIRRMDGLEGLERGNTRNVVADNRLPISRLELASSVREVLSMAIMCGTM